MRREKERIEAESAAREVINLPTHHKVSEQAPPGQCAGCYTYTMRN